MKNTKQKIEELQAKIKKLELKQHSFEVRSSKEYGQWRRSYPLLP
jgi:hypothetical protein